MKKNMIEEDIQASIRNFKYDISEHVWNNIEKELNHKKKRRIALYVCSSLCLLISLMFVGSYYQSNTEPGSKKGVSKIKSNNEQHLTNTEQEININSQNKTEVQIKHLSEYSGSIQSTIAEQKNEVNKVTSTTHPSYTNTDNTLNIFKEGPVSESIESNPLYAENKLIYPAPLSSNNMKNDLTTDITLIRKKDTIIIDLPSTTVTKKTSNMAKKESHLEINTFFSTHGTGDLWGTFLEIGKVKMLSKRFSFYNNVGISLHSGQAYLGVGANGSVSVPLNSARTNMQTVTAGIQTTPTIVFNSIGKDLHVGFGLVGRYQNSSGPDAFGVNYLSSAYTTTPTIPQITMYSSPKPNTFSFGYRVSLELMVRYAKRKDYGLQLFFQNDTRGDVIGGLGMSFKFK